MLLQAQVEPLLEPFSARVDPATRRDPLTDTALAPAPMTDAALDLLRAMLRERSELLQLAQLRHNIDGPAPLEVAIEMQFPYPLARTIQTSRELLSYVAAHLAPDLERCLFQGSSYFAGPGASAIPGLEEALPVEEACARSPVYRVPEVRVPHMVRAVEEMLRGSIGAFAAPDYVWLMDSRRRRGLRHERPDLRAIAGLLVDHNKLFYGNPYNLAISLSECGIHLAERPCNSIALKLTFGLSVAVLHPETWYMVHVLL